jgi:hypothetical protein
MPRSQLRTLIGRIADMIAMSAGGIDFEPIGHPGAFGGFSQHALGRR